MDSFFASVLTVESPMRQTLPVKIDRCENSPRFSPLTVEQVKEKLVKLKSNKSCGPDGIHVNVLRMVPSLAIPLCDIFNHSGFFFFSVMYSKNREMVILHRYTKQVLDNHIQTTDQYI